MEDSPTQSHVLQLAHPPIPIVRIGIIGLGIEGYSPCNVICK